MAAAPVPSAARYGRAAEARAHRWLAVVVMALLAGSACGDRPRETSPESPEASPMGVDARAAVAGFDASRLRFARLDAVVLVDPAAAREAARERLGDADPNVRLAALYVLAWTMTAEDAERLAAFLAAGDPTERLIAARALIAVGDPRAVPVLIEALGSSDRLRLSEPRPAWAHGRIALLGFTGQDFGLRDASGQASAAATQEQWRSWWQSAGSSFRVVRAPGAFR